MKEIQAVLKRLYDKLGIRKDIEFCKKCNITQNTVAGWRHRDTIPYEFLKKIAAQENISFIYLLTGQDASTLTNAVNMDEREEDILRLFRELRKEEKELAYFKVMYELSKIKMENR